MNKPATQQPEHSDNLGLDLKSRPDRVSRLANPFRVKCL